MPLSTFILTKCIPNQWVLVIWLFSITSFTLLFILRVEEAPLYRYCDITQGKMKARKTGNWSVETKEMKITSNQQEASLGWEFSQVPKLLLFNYVIRTLINRNCHLETALRFFVLWDFACQASRGRRRTCLTGTIGSTAPSSVPIKVSSTLRTFHVRGGWPQRWGRDSPRPRGLGQRCMSVPKSLIHAKTENEWISTGVRRVSSFVCSIYPYNTLFSFFNPLPQVNRKQ